MSSALDGSSRPHLAPGVRLARDTLKDRMILLGPEAVVAPNPAALAILERVDGRSIDAIVDALMADFIGERSQVSRDVIDLMDDLIGRGLVVVSATATG